MGISTFLLSKINLKIVTTKEEIIAAIITFQYYKQLCRALASDKPSNHGFFATITTGHPGLYFIASPGPETARSLTLFHFFPCI